MLDYFHSNVIEIILLIEMDKLKNIEELLNQID
jgi:hypothetical protein